MKPAPGKRSAADRPGQPAPSAGLDELYRGFEQELLVPLWTQIGDLMPTTPTPTAIPHRWKWNRLLELAERAGKLVPVGRGGERRAIALANPGLGGAPYATPTLWAAIQYLNPGEDAPVHSHTQHAFRFVVEGEGVWTLVDGDPVAMRRGDFLLTPGWNFHGHHNQSATAMAWLDGLDIPFARYAGTTFFEDGPETVADRSTPARSRAERLWAHPGLRPVARTGPQPSSPLAAYRWEHTDAALADQLALEDEGHPGVVEPGHAAVRFSNPTTGGDVLPTLRAEMHRLRAGTTTARRREVGSAVWQVFDGHGRVSVGDREWDVSAATWWRSRPGRRCGSSPQPRRTTRSTCSGSPTARSSSTSTPTGSRSRPPPRPPPSPCPPPPTEHSHEARDAVRP